MSATIARSRRFDASLLFSVDDLIAESEAAHASDAIEVTKAANPYQAEADAHTKHEARMEACYKACWKLAAWAHTYSKTCPIPARDACFRVLDRWYVLCGEQPMIRRGR